MDTRNMTDETLKRLAEQARGVLRQAARRIAAAPDVLLDAATLLALAGLLALSPAWWSWLLVAVVLLAWLGLLHRRTAR